MADVVVGVDTGVGDGVAVAGKVASMSIDWHSSSMPRDLVDGKFVHCSEAVKPHWPILR